MPRPKKRSTPPKKARGNAQAPVDLKDPKQADRIRSADYKEIYSNAIELSITPNDVRIKFLQIFGDKEGGHLGKILLEERGAVTLSHQHALRFSKVFADLVDRNISITVLEPTDSEIKRLRAGPKKKARAKK